MDKSKTRRSYKTLKIFRHQTFFNKKNQQKYRGKQSKIDSKSPGK